MEVRTAASDSKTTKTTRTSRSASNTKASKKPAAKKVASGKKKSRPFTEIEILWEALCLEKIVHVDTALGGSGTSRTDGHRRRQGPEPVVWRSRAAPRSREPLCGNLSGADGGSSIGRVYQGRPQASGGRA